MWGGEYELNIEFETSLMGWKIFVVDEYLKYLNEAFWNFARNFASFLFGKDSKLRFDNFYANGRL